MDEKPNDWPERAMAATKRPEKLNLFASDRTNLLVHDSTDTAGSGSVRLRA